MSRHAANGNIAASSANANIADRLLFLALLSLLASRMLIAEGFERVQSSFLGGASVAGPTPATTAWLDCTTLVVSSVAMALRPPQLNRNRLWTAGFGLLLIAIAISTLFAGEKQVAALAGANLVVLIFAAGALTGVSRDPWMPRLILATAIACAGANAVKCFQQVGYEFDDTARYWRDTQRPQLEQRGVDLSDPMIIDYERRLASQNAFGLLAHPNVASSIMATGAVLALAAALRLLPKRLTRAAPDDVAPGDAAPIAVPSILAGIALALAAIAGVLTTGSNGALLSSIIAAAVLIASCLSAARTLIRPGIVITAYFSGLALLFVAGTLRGTLPGASLAFRWEYWTAGLRAWLDSPWLGVGRMNFISAYLQYRGAAATEEVKDAHNLWVTLLVELGPIGMIAGILLLVALVRSILRHGPASGSAPASRATTSTPRGWLIATVAGVLAMQAFASGYPLQDANIALLWAVEFAAVWIVLLLVSLVAVEALAANTQSLRYACLAALGCLLIHNWVDFSLTTPPGLAMAALVASAALSPRRLASGWNMPGFAISGMVAVVLHFMLVAMPVSAIDATYRTLASINAPLTIERAKTLQVLAHNSWDSDTPGTIAAQLMAHARLSDPPSPQLLEEARVFAERCVEFNDRSAANWALLARVIDMQVTVADTSTKQKLARRATQAWERSIDLYPTNPRTHLAAAAAHAVLRRFDRTVTDASMVGSHISMARKIDNSRDPRVAARLRPEELAQLAALEAEVSASQPSP